MKKFQVISGPFINDAGNTSKIMRHLLIALMPIILFSFFKNGILPYVSNKVTLLGMFYPLIFILLGATSTVLIEFLYARLILKKEDDELTHYMHSSYSVFPGLFLALVLPINTPISILFFGCVMATVVGKLLFGGFGNNIFNPALIGLLFISIVYGPLIAERGGYLNALEMDAITTATPLSNVATVEGIGTYETLVKPYGSLYNFLFGTIPGSLGETSAILCILAFFYLTIFKVIKWRIPVVYVSTVFAMTYVIGGFNNLGIWYPLFQILSGGLLFGAVFMATDPVTSPTTPIGEILYGLFLGILTVIIRYFTPYPEGVMVSILTLNMLVFIFDKIGARARFNFNKAVPGFLFAWIIILGLSLYIGNQYKVSAKKSDPEFNILEKNVSGDTTNYVVTQKGFSGNIKASIVIEEGFIKKIDILEIKDNYYSKVEKENYIEQIIDAQINLELVDTVSGVTITSSAIKKMVINTLKDYRGE
jgi:electron transport complex protein RnfD